MSLLTVEDVLSTARRSGWSITPARAAEIVASANPRIAVFERGRAQLTFDEDAAGFAAALLATRHVEEAAK